eukprot:6178803-Pleurochrysis_carterae.AAC.2
MAPTLRPQVNLNRLRARLTASSCSGAPSHVQARVVRGVAWRGEGAWMSGCVGACACLNMRMRVREQIASGVCACTCLRVRRRVSPLAIVSTSECPQQDTAFLRSVCAAV